MRERRQQAQASTASMARRTAATTDQLRGGPPRPCAVPRECTARRAAWPVRGRAPRPSPHRGCLRLGSQLCLGHRLDWSSDEHRLREHELPVKVHVEDPVCTRYNLDRGEVLLVRVEQPATRLAAFGFAPLGTQYSIRIRCNSGIALPASEAGPHDRRPEPRGRRPPAAHRAHPLR